MTDPKHPDDFGYTADGVIQWQKEKIKYQATEIERLRGALSEYACKCQTRRCGESMHECGWIARSALKEKK